MPPVRKVVRWPGCCIEIIFGLCFFVATNEAAVAAEVAAAPASLPPPPVADAGPDQVDRDKTEQRRRLVMALVGPTGLRARGVERALAGHFADLAIDVDVVQLERRSAGQLLTWARARNAVDALAIVMWFETHTSLLDESHRVGRLHLRWSDEDGRPRVYVRELRLEPGAQTSIEVLAVTVRSLSQAIASGELEGDPGEPDPASPAGAEQPVAKAGARPQASAAKPAVDRVDRAIDLELGYLGGSLANEPRWQHGLQAAIAVRFARRFGVGVQIGHQWAPGSDVEVELAIRRLPVSLRFEYIWLLPLGRAAKMGTPASRPIWRPSRHLELSAGLAGTLEWFSWQASDPGSRVLRESSGGRWRAGLGADVAGKWRFLGPLGLTVRASMQVWMANIEVSAVVGEGETVEVTEIPLVSPSWLSVTVFGGLFVRL